MPDNNIVARALACWALAGLAAAVAARSPLPLHVPSPDWRDQIVYFALIDRFDDADPRNNDQGHREHDARHPERFNGGDLKGLLRRLDYIQGLGATTLWITPWVRNQWVDGALGYYGYHGYWAQHFKQVDPHWGSLAELQALSRGLHGRGMYLMQDVVVNHVGNYFDIRGGGSADDPARRWQLNTRSRPTTAPTQPPFHLNDPRRAVHREAAIYHWTPGIDDHTNLRQEHTHQLSSLDDLNTENPAVRRALRKSYAHWIRAAGVDAMRIDTAFYVPPEFFEDFVHARDRASPGMAEAARRTGRRDFLVFGEGFGIDRPGEDAKARRIESYVRGPRGERRLHSMLNFPLYGTLGDVYARGRPAAELAERIRHMLALHTDPHRMPSFVDNHDVDRFLAGGSEPALKQALLAIMTLPGIPVVYYGTEQGFTQPRPAMFAAGSNSGGRDRFDTTAPLYRAIAAMAALRKGEKALTRGTPQVLHACAAGPGAIAWSSTHEGRSLVVAFNSADDERLLDNLDTGLAAGGVLDGRYGLDGKPADLVAGAGGRISVRLPPRAGWVWASAAPAVRATTAGAPATLSAARPITLEPPPPVVSGDFEVAGSAPGRREVLVVTDGDLARAVRVAPGADGRFTARIDTGRSHNGALTHRVVAWAADDAHSASSAHAFRVERPWQLLAEADDPAGDDRGPTGSYRAPTHPSYVAGLMDLRRVRALGNGGTLRIEVETGAHSGVWSPANGFDHVVYTVYIELPGRPGGARVLPLQGGEAPAGLAWHRRLRAHGWSNALFDAEGASATSEGRPIAPAAMIAIDAARRTVSFTLPAAALGDLPSLAGTRVWVTTWDYDGGYRALAVEPGPFTFGGGGTGSEAKVLDASPVLTLR
ncbi:MAG: hypothetical protein FJ404_15400 [Verrucomicrobia bacterium]|nr:hypothetical protein [Verrucomicrobiota bacterium]